MCKLYYVSLSLVRVLVCEWLIEALTRSAQEYGIRLRFNETTIGYGWSPLLWQPFGEAY